MRKSRHITAMFLLPISIVVLFVIQALFPSASAASKPRLHKVATVAKKSNNSNYFSPYLSKTVIILNTGNLQHPYQVIKIPAQKVFVHPAVVTTTTTTTTSPPEASYSTPQTTYTAPATSTPVGSGGWWQIAICEEGGSNSYTFGYFGIIPQSWGNYSGVSTAGQASYAVQVQRAEQIDPSGPPWCPPNCEAGGYRGW